MKSPQVETRNGLFCIYNLSKEVHHEKVQQGNYSMTDKEKENDKNAYLRGGYLKKFDFKEACNTMWNKFTLEEKECIMQLPNFNNDVFFEITGIKI